jgi:type VI secretion system secreted protein VgrG
MHGIVAEFDVTGYGRSLTYYSARIVPKMWLLTRRFQSQIFQDLATPDILKKMLEAAGLKADEDFKLGLKRSYKPRKYCVQYRESDMDFVSRLMEEEGIFYWFEHTEDGHVLRIADNSSAHEPILGESTLAFLPGDEGRTQAEAISDFRYGKAVRTGKVTLREFDFVKPTLDMTASSPADKWKELERYEYPGDYHVNGLGSELVKIRLEEEQAWREGAEGEGTCRMMAPGQTFTLDLHKRDALNQEYLITEISHYGTQPHAAEEDNLGTEGRTEPTYENEFECLPKSRPFRPERVTPRPRVEGPQTAIVTGPSGEEIHTDEHGRVKVKFFWDRSSHKDDKSSCWIRVSQGWSGAAYGSMIIPRIGHEVIVEFLEGDPDRPLITGRVYNGGNVPPYALPANKTRSTLKSDSSPGGGGSNELRFEDKKGSEEIYAHAQKDYNIVVENDRTRTVGHDETWEVGNDQTGTVKHDQKLTVKNNRTKRVDVDQSESIGGNKTIDVTGNHTETIHKSKKVNVTLGHTETVNAYQSITIGGARMLKVGAAFTQTVVGLKSTTVGASLSVKVSRNYSVKVNGNRKTDIGKNYDEKVKGTHTEFVDGDFVLHAKNLELMAEEKILISVGKATITMEKDGTIQITGKKMNIKGTEIGIDGDKLTQKMSGDIIQKGSNIKQN